eukprot:8928858-Lingulodinium_polyedra.AAC.1
MGAARRLLQEARHGGHVHADLVGVVVEHSRARVKRARDDPCESQGHRAGGPGEMAMHLPPEQCERL